MTEATWWDALDQASAQRTGTTNAVELTSTLLNRIDTLNPRLGAYVSVDRDGAMATAQAADELRRHRPEEAPPFLGVPLSVKDVIDVAGLATTHSSKALVNNVAEGDDPLVRRFRQAGFVIVGKTNVPEFCTSMTTSELNGVCRNPWDVDRTPGGSSGGAAAALAAGLCAVSHGTDGAGSVRVPAAFCGLVGLKPSRGLIAFGPHEGDAYFGTSVPGVLTRSVRDAAALLDVMTGSSSPWAARSPRPAQSYLGMLDAPLEPLRVAVSTAAPIGGTEALCADAAVRVGQVLESLGHRVEQADPDWSVLLAPSAGPMSVPGAAALVPAEQYDLVEPRNRPLLSNLAKLTVLEHFRWMEQVRVAARTFVAFWEDVDVLVTPTCGIPPPAVSWAPWDQTPQEHRERFSSFPNFAQPFNVSGQPALSLPLAWSSDGLPIGVQLAGRFLDEGLLLRLCSQLEGAMPWSGRIPPHFA